MDELLLWIGQGTAIVALVSLTAGRSRHISASMRYGVWWTTLAVVVALPVVSTLELPGFGALLGFAVSADPLPVAAIAATQPSAASSWTTMLLLLGAAAWAIVNAARTYAALAHLDATKRSCKPFPVLRERQLARWKTARNRGRRATLVVSDQVRAAGVLGLGYPRIAINPELVSRLSDEELDQLVLHEYAHVQRRDDVAAVAQAIVRSLVGWHPAVWWIDRRLRVEREVACDDWVVAATEAPRTFAQCLTRIADLSVGCDSLLVPASSRRSHLTMRVTRLLDGQRNTSTRISGFAVATATVLLTAISIGLAGRQVLIVPKDATVAERSFPPSATPTGNADAGTQARTSETRRASGGRRVADAARAALASAVGTAEASTLPVLLASADVTDAGRANLPPRIDAAPPAEPDTRPVAAAAPAPPPVATAPDETSASDAPAILPASDALAESEESSWVTTSGRAVATASVVASKSIAEAGVSAGSAVVDAGQAAYRGSRSAAVKTARFVARLGKKVAKPF